MSTLSRQSANELNGLIRIAERVFNRESTPQDFYLAIANANDETIRALCEIIGVGSEFVGKPKQ